ncbi:MAG: putative toxin-antitoxin system toxin component, PIN family [Acidobacteria bacterium]|nr:MAG: putative toxin-antitoxin system toxin component, PIN family [Acidobacteriota bacterium]
MVRAVLDTNVVVSALLTPEGPPALILDVATTRLFRWYVSELLLEEYGEVLARARFGLDQRRIAKFMLRVRKMAIVVVPRRRLKVTIDSEDNKVMECALEARADYVVTGNVRHFPARFHEVRIVRPQQFLTVLAAQPR